MIQMHIVDLARPYREVRVVPVLVKVCAKTVWAIEANGRRHLVGSSAFQTPAAASRCRLAILQKLVANPANRYFRPYAVQRATEALGRVLH